MIYPLILKTYKSLKSVLDGGIEGKLENIIFMQHQIEDILCLGG